MAFRFNQGDRPLAGYTIERGVGRGGFGEVYYALSDGGKEVALKYLRENPQVELRGATHCLNLKSPYLIALHDIKQSAEGEFFVIMEYVNGVSLRDLMNEAPRGLGPQKAAYFVREIAKGLAYLHDRGIVHRDLKPGNIFYEDGFVKIGDYGLSKMMAASQHSGQTVSVGTVHYMAPEVGSGNYDRTIDIYALGVMLYEMLLGRVPYSGASMGEVLMKHLTAQPEVDELPAPFPEVIRKALAKDPKDRYQTVNEFVADLFEVEDLSRSVAAFEPASISTMAANAARKLAPAEATLPAGGGGVGVAFGTGSSNIGPPVAPPVLPPAGRIGRINQRVDRLKGQIDVTIMGEKVADIVGGARTTPRAITTAVLTCIALAGAACVIRHKGADFGAAIVLHALAILGGMVAWRKFLHHGAGPTTDFSSKLTFAVVAGLAVAAANGFVQEVRWVGSDVERWLVPIIASLVLCNWHGRVEAGRRGEVSLGSAFAIGLFGFIASQFADTRDSMPVMAILAGASLGIQALAGMWPLTEDELAAGRKPGSFSPGATPMTPGADPSSAIETVWAGGVAISRDGIPQQGGQNARVPFAHRTGGQGQVWPAGSGSAQLSTPGLPLRSMKARLPWLGGFLVLAVAMILCFFAAGLVASPGDERHGCIVAGIALAPFAAFMLSCFGPKYKKGLWRGIIRKLIFFTGLSMAASFSSSIGFFAGSDKEMIFGFLAATFFGLLSSILVWFIPVPMPKFSDAEPAAVDESDVDQNRLARANRCKLAGFGVFGLMFVVAPILLATLNSRDAEDALLGSMIPMAVVSIGFLVSGYTLASRVTKKPAPPIELPIRRVFAVESATLLRRLLDRHTFLYGYKLDREADMMWRYVRGDFLSQFWQSDVRRWKSELTIAAYEDGQGSYRVTAQFDLDANFNQPAKKMLERLNAEMIELESLLVGGSSAGGREIAV